MLNQRDMLNWKYLLQLYKNTFKYVAFKGLFSGKPKTNLVEAECAFNVAGMLIAMIADKAIHTICHLKLLASRLPPSLLIENQVIVMTVGKYYHQNYPIGQTQDSSFVGQSLGQFFLTLLNHAWFFYITVPAQLNKTLLFVMYLALLLYCLMRMC